MKTVQYQIFLKCSQIADLSPFIISYCAAAAKSLQSCPTLCDPIDDSPPGSPVPGIFQTRTLEWVAISFSNAGKWKVNVKWLSHVRLFATPWTSAHQAPPSMGFSRQEYWSVLPLPSPVYTSTLILISASSFTWHGFCSNIKKSSYTFVVLIGFN